MRCLVAHGAPVASATDDYEIELRAGEPTRLRSPNSTLTDSLVSAHGAEWHVRRIERETAAGQQVLEAQEQWRRQVVGREPGDLRHLGGIADFGISAVGLAAH